MIETNHITYESLLLGNKNWVEKTLQENPDYFEKLASGQKPPILWIGCSDSRVPANQVTGTLPGEIFVHRNIANVIAHNDLNMLSVLDYAVNVLKVNHVIINGHYGCGGVAAAMSDKQFGLIDNWLRNIKDVYRIHKEEVDAIQDEEAKIKRMVDLNVIEGVHKLSATAIVQNAWAKGQDLQLHGWVLDLNTGLIKDLEVSCTSNVSFDKVFKIA
ncbi:carbonic anhydrase [Pseudopedobacter sp.]|uniref:carbonic anhydrase n=1 Tax=Pseudopedobacter sp. TaxID=1936787 RepID=UPI00333E3EE3